VTGVDQSATFQPNVDHPRRGRLAVRGRLVPEQIPRRVHRQLHVGGVDERDRRPGRMGPAAHNEGDDDTGPLFRSGRKASTLPLIRPDQMVGVAVVAWSVIVLLLLLLVGGCCCPFVLMVMMVTTMMQERRLDGAQRDRVFVVVVMVLVVVVATR
jgi:hypothetical protein